MTFRIDRPKLFDAKGVFPITWSFTFKGFEGKGIYRTWYAGVDGKGLFGFDPPEVFPIDLPGCATFSCPLDLTPDEARKRLAVLLTGLGWGPQAHAIR